MRRVMDFGALGDVHGDFDSARRIMARHPEVPFWLSVGDIADAEGRYVGLCAPLYFIKGNNENFDALASGHLAENLHVLPSARLTTLGGVRVAGLGGTFAPSWYETPASDLPHPVRRTARATILADKRRHFVREEVEACKSLSAIDVFLTHEAPRPYRIGPVDAGKTAINEVLAAVRPRLHLFGHHHRFTEQDPQGVRSVGLALVSDSYLLIDATTLEYRRMSS